MVAAIVGGAMVYMVWEVMYFCGTMGLLREWVWVWGRKNGGGGVEMFWLRWEGGGGGGGGGFGGGGGGGGLVGGGGGGGGEERKGFGVEIVNGKDA